MTEQEQGNHVLVVPEAWPGPGEFHDKPAPKLSRRSRMSGVGRQSD